MQKDIYKKLRDHLNSGVSREADVVYLFVEIGKYLEQNESPQYPLIRFYRNWIVHSQINDTRLAGDISIALDQALSSGKSGDYHTMTIKMMGVLSKEKLRKELNEYFDAVGLPKDIFTEQPWRKFLRLLVGVLVDVPVKFTGLQKLEDLKFKEDQDDGYIWCEVNGKGNGISFLWTQLHPEKHVS